MPRRVKLPKTIRGIRIPRSLRKPANKVIARLQGEELEALLSALIAAALIHYFESGRTGGKDAREPLRRKLAGTVESHLGR